MKKRDALLTILLIGVFFISFVSAGWFSDSWNKITGKVVDNENICTDSDGGLNYYVRGTVKATGAYDAMDVCAANDGAFVDSSNKLLEYSCDTQGSIFGAYHNCSNGCVDGACRGTLCSLSEGNDSCMLTKNIESVQEPSAAISADGKAVVVFNAGYQKIKRGLYSIVSEDSGKTWTEPSYVIDSWDDSSLIQNNNGEFVLLAQNGKGLGVWISKEGINWIYKGSVKPTDYNYEVGSIIQAKDNTYFVVYSSSSSDVYVTSSSDFLSWSEPVLLSNIGGEFEFDADIIQGKDGKFVVVYNSYQEKGLVYVTSSEGVVWTSPQLFILGTTTAHIGLNQVLVGDKIMVFFSMDGEVYSVEYDGTKWAFFGKLGLPYPAQFGADIVMAHDLGAFYMVDSSNERALYLSIPDFIKVENFPFQLISESNQTTLSCTDSDGGLNLYEKGNTQGYFVSDKIDTRTDICQLEEPQYGEGHYRDVDSCEGSLCHVFEHWSSGDKSCNAEILSCRNGCVDGACIEEESDAMLSIINIIPSNGKITTTTNFSIINFSVETNIYAKCSYSFKINEERISFVNTTGTLHTQPFNLPLGLHTLFISCNNERGESNVTLVFDISNKYPNEISVCNINNLGYRKSSQYCSEEGFVSQKDDSQSCENNFECLSNSCIDGNCVKLGFWTRIFDWFRNLFG